MCIIAPQAVVDGVSQLELLRSDRGSLPYHRYHVFEPLLFFFLRSFKHTKMFDSECVSRSWWFRVVVRGFEPLFLIGDNWKTIPNLQPAISGALNLQHLPPQVS